MKTTRFVAVIFSLAAFSAHAQLVPDFTFTSTGGPCNPGLISFTNQTTGGTVMSYIWSLGDGTTSTLANPVHQYTAPGTYTVTLTVRDSANVPYNINKPVLIMLFTVSINQISATCNACDAQAGALVSGGTAPYSFSWSAGTPTGVPDSVSGLCPGDLTVVVTDSNGCTTSTTDAILGVVNIIISKVDPSCNGSCDGYVDLTVTGGTPPYTYLWSNGITTEDATNLCAGTYTVTVTDGSSCSTTTSVTLVDQPAMIVTLNVTNGSCASPGTICAVPSGSTAPYSFTWSTAATTSCITVAQNATYTITVTSSNGCTATASAFVNGGVTAQILGPSCACNGYIQLFSSGGTYMWNTGDTTSSISNLCVGTYLVTITDTGGVCLDTFILTPRVFSVQIIPGSSNCNSTSANATAIASGGGAPYSFLWSNNSTSQYLQGVPSGTYHLTVTDVQGCTATDSIVLVTNTFTVTETLVNPTCGNTDGSVSISVTGGSGSFTYTWSVPGTTTSITGLAPGNYSVTVRDASTQCSVTETYTLYGSCGTVSGHVFNDANRNGVQDTGENGLPGIQVELNAGGLTAITNQNGDYTIGVGVFDTFSIHVNAPSRYACSGTAFIQDSVTSPAGNNYSVIVTVGNPDVSGYDFGVSQPQQPCGIISGYVFDDQNQNGIDDGEPRKNGVIVRLSNGQSAVTDFFGMYSIEAPLNVPLTVSVTPAPTSYFCGSNQSTFVQTYPPLGGTYNVTLTSGSPNSTGNDFGIHTAPFYDVMVVGVSPYAGNQAGMTFNVWMDYKAYGTSSLNCTLRLSFDSLVHFVSASYTPTTVTSTYIEWEYLFGTAPSWNCMTMTFYLDSSATAGTVLRWTGTYGCGSPDGCPNNNSATTLITVVSGPLRQAQSNGLNSMDVIHSGNANDIITTNDSSFSYFINFQNSTSDTAYHLTVVDTLSPHLNIETISTPFSSHAYTLSIPQPNILIWEFDGINLPDSTTDYLNSYGFIQYNINMKPNLSPGTKIEQRAAISFNHLETVLTNTTSVTVYEPLAISADVTDVSCIGENDGGVDITVTGGSLPYDFLWNTGATDKDLQNVSAGNYSVVITDANGFTSTISATVAEGADVNAGSIAGADTAGIGQLISFSVNQVAGYAYVWRVTNGTIASGQGTSNVEVNFGTAGQGAVSVDVTELNCTETVSKTVTIVEPDGIWNLSGGTVMIYPNPGKGLFSVILPASVNEDAVIKVYDLPGRLVLEKIISQERTILLNISEQPDGMYFVRIAAGERQHNGKVMLLR